MTDEEIERHLKEASFPNCDREQLEGILDLFLARIPVEEHKHLTKAKLKRELVSDLFWQTRDEDPRGMPSLLPVFKILLRPVQVAANRQPRRPKKWEKNRDAS